MKSRLLLFIAFVAATMTVSAQTFIYEDFSSGQMPPTGWTISGLSAQWSISQSANAGGNAPEAMFTYVNQTTTTRLISPVVNLTGLTSVKLSFKHFYDWYSNPAPKVGVATRTSATGTWNSVWEITPTGNVGPQDINLTITNTDVGSATFQFCFYLNGNMYNLDYYYVDNVILLNPLPKDGFLVSIEQTQPYFSVPVPVKGTVLNTGVATINSADIDYQLDNGMVYSTSVTGLTAQTLQSFNFTCTDLINPPIGAHNLKVWIKNINGSPDSDLSNDSLAKSVSKVCYSNYRKPLYEEFTSSTCNPCAQFNTTFVPWCNAHDDQISLLKYQMNWPGTGDPYYTAEGGVRRDYYGVTWVPWLECNGGFVNTDDASVQAAFDQETQKIGMFDIAATHSLSGHVITVTANILPFANFSNCRVYLTVAEKITHNNATSNGETSFEHVMMKMLPDAEGTSVDFTDRVPFTVTKTADLTGTHVEEWTDLMVVVWVQNYQTREIYQSIYSVENGTFASEDRLSNIKVDGTSIPGFSSDLFDYASVLPGGATSAPVVTGIPIDTNETVIVVPALELPGTTTIDVFAANNIDHSLYTVNFSWATGINEPGAKAVTVYPNPSYGKVFISGADHAKITVYSTTGMLVRSVPDFSVTSIDMAGLEKGVYTLRIERTDHRVITKKVVVL
jgi:hypothetical protein